MPFVSRDGNIDPPALAGCIGLQRSGLSITRSFQQGIAQPLRIILIQAECVAKDSCLVSATRMCRIEAIGLKFAQIENEPVAVR